MVFFHMACSWECPLKPINVSSAGICIKCTQELVEKIHATRSECQWIPERRERRYVQRVEWEPRVMK